MATVGAEKQIEEARLCFCWQDMRKLTFDMQRELRVYADRPAVRTRRKACGKEVVVRRKRM